jgi:serine/threonine-protein kinase RsbT
MVIHKSERLPIIVQEDIVRARHMARQWALDSCFKLVDQTKFVTAVSELARNTLIYGKGGSMLLEAVQKGPGKGLRATFEDNGPGIPNIEQALQNGFTTGGGLGLGLGGAKRLSDEFEIVSKPGEGTRITVARWA